MQGSWVGPWSRTKSPHATVWPRKKKKRRLWRSQLAPKSPCWFWIIVKSADIPSILEKADDTIWKMTSETAIQALRTSPGKDRQFSSIEGWGEKSISWYPGWLWKKEADPLWEGQWLAEQCPQAWEWCASRLCFLRWWRRGTFATACILWISMHENGSIFLGQKS